MGDVFGRKIFHYNIPLNWKEFDNKPGIIHPVHLGLYQLRLFEIEKKYNYCYCKVTTFLCSEEQLISGCDICMNIKNGMSNNQSDTAQQRSYFSRIVYNVDTCNNHGILFWNI